MKGKAKEMKWNKKEKHLTKYIYDITFTKNMESDRTTQKKR